MSENRPDVVHIYHAEDEHGNVLVHPATEAPYGVPKIPREVDRAEYIALPHRLPESHPTPHDFTYYTQTPEGRGRREAAEADPQAENFPIQVRRVGSGSFEDYIEDAARKDLSEQDRIQGTLYFPVPPPDPDPNELFPQ